MTVEEMWDRLTELVDDGHGSDEVMLATQPNWPLRFKVGGICTEDEALAASKSDDDEPDADALGGPGNPDDEKPGIVYITEGGHPHDDSPYAPKGAWEAAR
jgi:hypothetical protein